MSVPPPTAEVVHRNELELGLVARVADIDLTLTAAVRDGEKASWSFQGRVDAIGTLRDLVNRLYRELSGESRELFDSKLFPPVEFSSLAVDYSSKPSRFVVRSTFTKLGIVEKLAFAFARLEGPGGGAPIYVAGIRSEGAIDLVRIADGGGSGGGLISQLLGDVSLDRLGLYYATEPVDAFPFLASEAGGAHGQAFASGLSFSARFGARGSIVDLALPEAKPRSGPGALPGAPTARTTQPAVPPATGATRDPPAAAATRTPRLDKDADAPFRYWKPVNKTFGPLELRRIGGEWDGKASKLGILFDAAVELLGLKIGLAGLSVRVQPSRLTKLKFEDLEFALDGLELNFQRGALSVAGALLRSREGGRDAYAGLATIRAASFAIAAMGAYTTTKENKPSFFIFGAFVGLLGGPPCFIVQGIAAAFGYNRGLVLPDADGVRDFPLVSLVLGPAPAGTSAPPSLLEQLGSADSFPATTGQYWIAAGVKFSSFKLIEAFALLTVQFGTRLEIALLGVASLQQPPSPTPHPFLYIELALKVRFAPDDGLLSAAVAVTANSYLFEPRCKLTGGMAFYIWFTPTNPKMPNRAGDFVVTLGGYHPKFKVPAHYPRLPRVGFSLQFPEWGVIVKGEAYFALTPSFIMMGGRLSAVFKSGDFEAWFEAHYDVLIGWAPFHYDADIGVRIGAAFTLRLGDLTIRLKFELGAQLRLWGPPFAGEATVRLGFISFTVPLGDRSAARSAPPLTWKQFADRFLPRADNDSEGHRPLSVAVTAGMISERSGVDGYLVVNPAELVLSVESLIPVMTLSPGNLVPDKMAKPPGKQPNLGIRPMGVGMRTSTLELSCKDAALVYWPIEKNLPQALWSPEAMPDPRKQNELESEVIKNCLTGVQIMPADEPEASNWVRVNKDVELTPIQIIKPPKPAPKHAPYPSGFSDRTAAAAFQPLRAALADAHVTEARRAAVAAMQAAGFDLPDGGSGDDEHDLPNVLLAAPWMVKMGELLPLAHG